MFTKKNAIDTIKELLGKHANIKLEVINGCAAWAGKSENYEDIDFETAKDIGRVSALAFAFDIDHLGI